MDALFIYLFFLSNPKCYLFKLVKLLYNISKYSLATAKCTTWGRSTKGWESLTYRDR